MICPNWPGASVLSFVLLLSSLEGQTSSSGAETRVWNLGQAKSIEATLRGIEGDKFILQAGDGRVASIPASQFSEDDQNYVRATIHSRVAEALGRPGEASPARSGWRGPISVEHSHCEVLVTKPTDTLGRIGFQSRHFAFTAPADLDASAQRDIAEFFQIAREIHRVAPWGLLAEPSGKDRFEVEIYAQNEDYIRSGGREGSMAEYDQESRILRCTYEALGIINVGATWMRSEQPQSGRVAAIALHHMMLHNLIGTIPHSLFQGIARCLAEIPIVGPTAWPNLPPDADAEKLQVSEPKWLASLTSLLASPPSPLTDSDQRPVASAAESAQIAVLAIHYWARLDGDGSAPHLASFLQEAQKDGIQWHTYNEALRTYRVAWEKFKTSPGVIDLGEGRVRYPEGMKPPESPRPPQNVQSMDEVPYFHIRKLTAGRAPEEVALEILNRLKKEGY